MKLSLCARALCWSTVISAPRPRQRRGGAHASASSRLADNSSLERSTPDCRPPRTFPSSLVNLRNAVWTGELRDPFSVQPHRNRRVAAGHYGWVRVPT
jgi:hypothetical protein